MKKFMLALAIVACAIGAQAVTTYTYKTLAKPWPSAKGAQIENGDLPYMNVYGLSASQVSDIIGTTVKGGVITSDEGASAVTAINAWIKNNFALANELWGQGVVFTTQPEVEVVATKGNYQVSKYETSESVADSWEDLQYMVNFYTGDKVGEGNGAFRVVAYLDSSTSQYIGGGTSSHLSWGTWTTTTIPEPTSGLLMLLGVAGLALKRKRA